MFVFDWDGNPKQILLLDQGIFAFTVDKENKKIYGISDKPDFHLVAFSYNWFVFPCKSDVLNIESMIESSRYFVL